MVLPHLCLGAGLLNHLSVINTGPSREIQLELMDSLGELVGVSQSNLESGGFLQVDLAQLFQVGSDVDGWLRLSPGADLAARTDDFFTGLGLLNDSPFVTAVSAIELFDPAGQRLGVHFLTLGPGEKRTMCCSNSSRSCVSSLVGLYGFAPPSRSTRSVRWAPRG